MRTKLAALAISATALLGTSVLPAASVSAATVAHVPSCARWSTSVQTFDNMVKTRVRKVRAEQHACFDRFVIVLGSGPMPGYTVQYVPQIIQDGSGKPIKVKGRAKLSIVVEGPARQGFPVNSHNLVNVTGYKSFRQVVAAGSFEGKTSFGIGVRAKLGFRVLFIKKSRQPLVLVVDVAHK